IYWKSSINHCNRTRTIKDMQILAEKREGFCISNEYINRQNPLEWQCKKGHKWKASPKDIIKESWCRQCRYLNIDIAINIAQERGGKCLSTEYKNSNTPMLWRCIQGHEWYAPLTRIKDKKRWCAQCAGIKPCGLEACQKIAYSKGGACLSTEYKNLNVLMQWKCNFLKTPEYPRGLELDIYYPQHGLAIEVQGIQHSQYRKRFHKNEEDFEKQLIRDQLKKELCEENWIVL
ncbi:40233_t:CDS:2, partial [Gigaspora margarita]